MLDIDKVVNRLQHYKQLKKFLEAHETRSASIALRKKWYERQRQSNYMNEYNRIRGELSRSVLKGVSRAHLEKRKSTLEALGAVAMDKIS
jgi:hypothetical protein